MTKLPVLSFARTVKIVSAKMKGSGFTNLEPVEVLRVAKYPLVISKFCFCFSNVFHFSLVVQSLSAVFSHTGFKVCRSFLSCFGLLLR